MSKELSEETKYELNLFGREINKDLTNLMDLLRKQDKDNKPVFYVGKHIRKVILPVEEYQKMCQSLHEYNRLIKEYDIKPTEVREAFVLYKMKYADIKIEIEKIWWYIDWILDKALGLQRTELSKEMLEND